MDNRKTTKSVYAITSDPQFQNKRFGVTPELQSQLESLGIEAQTITNTKIIDKLIRLIDKYPKVPLLKNYLSVAYNIRGNYAKAMELNDWIRADHPDYLFGRINEANDCIEKSDYEKVPEILGPALEISQLYPDRKVFHFAEVTNYFKVVIRYYAAIGNLEMAENRLEELKVLAPDEPDTKNTESYLITLRMESAFKSLIDQKEKTIAPKVQKVVTGLQNTGLPQFNHVQINCLYEFGLSIPHEKLREIISLPRTTLIEDLEKVLMDGVNRYDFFVGIESTEATDAFVLHALFLLKEIQAVESLPIVFSFLRCDNEVLDLWLGDHLMESLWMCLYTLGFACTNMLKDFLMESGVDTYAKMAVSEALCQIVLHNPERRDEISTVYADVFTHFSEATLEDNLIDSEFLGLAICDTINCNLHELLPIIKFLHDKGYVSLMVNGTYENVEKAFADKPRRNYKKELYTIVELYANVLKTWAGYNEDKQPEPLKPIFPINAAVANNVGRNDPCPCGSGKKYKKCCM